MLTLLQNEQILTFISLQKLTLISTGIDLEVIFLETKLEKFFKFPIH